MAGKHLCRIVVLVAALLSLPNTFFGQDNSTLTLSETSYLEILRQLGAGKHQQAMTELERLIDKQPQFGPAYDKLVEAAQSAGMLDQVAASFQARLSSTPKNTRAYYGLALVESRRKNPQLSIEHLHKCLESLPDFAPAYKLLVDSFLDLDKPADAEADLNDLLHKNPGFITPYYGLGYLYQRQRRWDDGLKALDKMISHSPSLIEAQRSKALIYYYTNRYKEALEMNVALLELAKSQSDIERQLDAVTTIGILNRILGDHAKAASELKEALNLAEQIGNLNIQNTCFSNLSGVYWQQDEYSLALSYGQRWLDTARLTKNKQSEGRAIGNLAAIYRVFGDLAQAQVSYERGLNLAKEQNDQENISAMLSDLGGVQTELKKYDQALINFQEALRITRKNRNRALERDALAGQAYLYFVMGNVSASLESQLQSLQLSREIFSPIRVGVSLNSLGWTYLKQSNLEPAGKSFQEALTIGERINTPNIIWQSHAGLALISEKQGRTYEARDHYQRAIETIERVRSRLSAGEDKTGFFHDKLDAYKGQIRTLIELHKSDLNSQHAANAFHYSELARSRAFLDMLSDARVTLEQNLAPALKEKQKNIENHLSRINQELVAERSKEVSKQDKRKIDRLQSELSEAEREWDNWLRELRTIDPHYAGLKYPQPITLVETKKQLDERSVMLAFSLGESKSYLFAVTKDKHLIKEIEPAASIRESVEKLLAAVSVKQTAQNSRQSAAEYRQQAAKLYQQLIAPAGELLAGKSELIIVADEALHRLPFELLLSAKSSPNQPWQQLPYLVRDFAISYVPSASVMAMLKNQKRQTTPKDFVAFADPIYLGEEQMNEQAKMLASNTRSARGRRLKFDRLPHSDEEVRQIARLFPAGKADLFLRQDATEENAKTKGALGQYSIVHFSAHGVTNEERPRFSGIVLSTPKRGEKKDSGVIEDGWLSAYEIFNLKLNADLVVLSACETGLGKEFKGDGLMSLARSFMYAGAPSVAVSLWKVDDKGTSGLMVEFYRQLKQHRPGERVTYSEALRQAQLKVIEKGNSPYFWAPFVLIGRQ